MSKSTPLPTNSGYPHPSWIEFIEDEIFNDRHAKLLQRVGTCSDNVFPPPQERYNALRLPLKMVKVVILGQDPYHKRGQAHGLAFSVKPETPVPPSLKNIYKELEKEGFGKASERNGYLQPWAEQGVLLLNTVLTVSEGKANSHKGWGWEALTDLVISSISEHQDHVVFMLWGKEAEKKRLLVDEGKHLVLTSPHPSPLSAYQGFLGNGHFVKANTWLETRGIEGVDW